jgi:hypothetical protein
MSLDTSFGLDLDEQLELTNHFNVVSYVDLSGTNNAIIH